LGRGFDSRRLHHPTPLSGKGLGLPIPTCTAGFVLGAGLRCGSEAEVRFALQFACRCIKPTDVVLVGMWQKEKDQLAQNVRWVTGFLT